jgi:hypothetical protein
MTRLERWWSEVRCWLDEGDSLEHAIEQADHEHPLPVAARHRAGVLATWAFREFATEATPRRGSNRHE